MVTRAQLIDGYFQNQNYYPHIPYRPIGKTVVAEVERQGANGLYLSTACALIEKESGGKAILGCDWGSKYTDVPPYCNVEATAARVKALIKNYYTPPIGGANGVSYTQLTSIGYVEEAERLGGAHLPSPNMRVGFAVLLDHILNLGWPAGAAAYNAGAGNWRAVINTYGADMALKERQWAARLAKASDGPKNPGRTFPSETLIPPGFVPLPPRTGGYQDVHPTRYQWEGPVAEKIHGLYEAFGMDIHVTTYVFHPGDEDNKWARDTAAFDVWGGLGRNDPLPFDLGAEAFRWLWLYEGKPDIDWIIYRRKIYTAASGYASAPFGSNPFSHHDDHIHETDFGNYRILA